MHRDSPHSLVTDVPQVHETTFRNGGKEEWWESSVCPPLNIISQMERSHVDPTQSGPMDLPSSVLCLQEGTQTSYNVGPTSSVSLQLSDNILVQNKDLWKEEHVTKLANKLAYCKMLDVLRVVQ